MFGVLAVAATIGFAGCVSLAISLAVGGPHSRGVGLDAVWGWLLAGLGCLAVRLLASFASEAIGARASAGVISQLRAKLATAIVERRSTRSSAELATITGPGLGKLDTYLSKYVPQLVLTALATPLILAVLFLSDWLTGVIVLVTLPAIPFFLALIGWATQSVQNRQFDALQTLSNQFLDVIEGLSTLKIFRRDARQADRIRSLTEAYRVRTMKVLRMSFLSGFVLEFAASISVAIVAVTIGVRLVDGTLPLTIGLFVLLVTPEAYLPLRMVGQQFHAAADGVAAADAALDIIEAPPAVALEAPDLPARGTLEARGIVIAHDGRELFEPLAFEVAPGEVVALSGPSGVGKSSLLRALMGFAPASGEVAFGGVPTTSIARRAAWLGQKPGLVSGSIRENVRLGCDADDAVIERSLALAGFADADLDRMLGVQGAGPSGGQAQRVALARAICRVVIGRASLMLLDEPTSALDSAHESEIIAGLREIAATGVGVLVVSHRPAVLLAADRVVRLSALAPVHSALVGSAEPKRSAT